MIADTQTQGRGQNGRWESQHQGLYMSLLRYTTNAPNPAISLFLGVLWWRVLSPYVASLRIKWPNDLVATSKKLGGILVETTKEMSGFRVVIGTGINLDGYPNLPHATDLATLAKTPPPSRNQLVSAFVHAFDSNWECFLKEGFTHFTKGL